MGIASISLLVFRILFLWYTESAVQSFCRHGYIPESAEIPEGEGVPPLTDSPFTLYKLIVLYALEKTSGPLTNAQLSDIFLSHSYTSYFHLQEVLSDMLETGLIASQAMHHMTCYALTEKGSSAIEYFYNDISPVIREEITAYLKEHARDIRNTSRVTADYQKTAAQDYLVHCRAQEKEALLMDLQITVPTESAARTMAENWREKSPEIYDVLLKTLLSE